VASIALGGAGLFLLVMVGFGLLFFLNLPCSILAWIFGVQGKRVVDRGESPQHRGLAQAGMITGIVGVALGVLALIAWILVFTLAISSDGGSSSGGAPPHGEHLDVLLAALRAAI